MDSSGFGNRVAEPACHICLISVHGLIRGAAPELGRDADTGGQVLYVVELARALARQASVARVDLITRLIEDPAVSTDYSQRVEALCEHAQIIRIAAGGSRYLPKESLWGVLDAMADSLVDYYRSSDSRPAVIHSHYADAGYVGSHVSQQLQIPLIHTGHSLGRVKRRRLLASGMASDDVDKRYNMRRRVIAEERTLACASRVIASTHHEIEEQYGLYNFYKPEAMCVIPPGTDLSRFHPYEGCKKPQKIMHGIGKFLRYPEKPMILALSRADPRKNIPGLLHAYGNSVSLREKANLVLVLGNRDELSNLDEGAQEVFGELLRLIDKYDLYGLVAYPKNHEACDVPALYRQAAESRGVLVNVALTEPFGLTLIEAAACGLPVVATSDGGPVDIIANCKHGLLVDPLEPESIVKAINTLLEDPDRWHKCSQAGINGAKQHYAWDAHAKHYVSMVADVLKNSRPPATAARIAEIKADYIDRALFSDLNRSLLGDLRSLQDFIGIVKANRSRMKFGICTGLRLDATLRLLRRHCLPDPDVIITSTGTSINYAPTLTEDLAWRQHIEKRWTPDQVRRILDSLPGISLRSEQYQSVFKISYLYDSENAPSIEEIRERLFREDQAVNLVHSHGRLLNIVPIRASKGQAMRYAVDRYGISLERTLAIAGSGADEDMIRGNTLAAIVNGFARDELVEVEQDETIHIATDSHAAGILESMTHFDFLGECRAPLPEPASAI